MQADLQAAAVAGAASGLATDVVTLPFDTLRARLNTTAHGAGLSAEPLQALLGMARRTVRTEGISGLYRGTSSVLVFCCPAYAVYFGTYKALANFLEARSGGSLWSYFAAGLAAELAGNVVYIPYDVTKQRLQTNSPGCRRTIVDELRCIVRHEGAHGLYRGVQATLLTYVPFSGIYFASYEALKRRMTSARTDGRQPGPGALFSAAVLAGAVASVATQPIDAVRTRIQVAKPGAVAVATSAHHPLSLVQTARHALAEEGPRALVRGTAARVLALAPGCGLTMALFEALLPYASRAAHVPCA